MKLLRTLLLSFILLSIAPTRAKADIMDDITKVLDNIVCETQGVGGLLRSEFSHTCIPAPFFSFAVANVVSPGPYIVTLLRLKLNDSELPLVKGACLRKNRIEFHDQKLSFYLCNNLLLAKARVLAVGKSIVVIAKAMFTGQDPWDEIKEAWNTSKADYHDKYEDRKEGDSGFTIDVPPIPWKVIKENDKLCVATIAFTGWIPVGCKYIKEPYPKSIYSSFMDSSKAPSDGSTDDVMGLIRCNDSGGCYQRAYEHSKTGIVISAPIIECIKEMTARLMISRDVCSFDDLNLVVGTAKRESSLFFQFQKNMHRTVMALLTIYVILFGFKVVLSGNIPPQNELINFVIKFIFVVYFSVGINVNSHGGSSYDRLDGMVQWILPFMLGGIDQLAGWVLSASPSNLCKFDAADYPKGLGYLSLWDAVDCRIAHYLGLDFLQTMLVENQSRNHDWKNFDIFNFSIPPYIYLLIPAVLSGYMTLVSMALMYPMLVISVGAYLVNSVVVCIICIVILGVLAPLFVPMLLFNYTKGYFESWLKLMISFVLQPMVMVTFMVTMFSVFDMGFYGKCEYKAVNVESGGRATKVFFIDNDWNKYKSPADVKSCKNSLGYMLNNPFAAVFDLGKSTVEAIKANEPESDSLKFMSKYEFFDALVPEGGMLFNFLTMIYERIKALVLALITACFTLYLMYHFSAQLSEFAADMTEGVALSNVTVKPLSLYKGMQALVGAAAGATDKLATGGRGADDKLSTGGGGAEDQLSTGGGGAEDQISTDDGGGRSRPAIGGGASDKIDVGDEDEKDSAGEAPEVQIREEQEIAEQSQKQNVEAQVKTDKSEETQNVAAESPKSINKSDDTAQVRRGDNEQTGTQDANLDAKAETATPENILKSLIGKRDDPEEEKARIAMLKTLLSGNQGATDKSDENGKDKEAVQELDKSSGEEPKGTVRLDTTEKANNMEENKTASTETKQAAEVNPSGEPEPKTNMADDKAEKEQVGSSDAEVLERKDTIKGATEQGREDKPTDEPQLKTEQGEKVGGEETTGEAIQQNKEVSEEKPETGKGGVNGEK